MIHASRDSFIFRNTIVPSNVHHFYKEHAHDDWHAVTWEEIHRKRTDQIRSNEWKKRVQGVVERKPGYVWVFYNNTNFFSGWYIYIVTLKNDWGINFRSGYSKELISKVQALFPMRQVPIFDEFAQWCENFCKEYPFNGFKKYGGHSKKHRPHQGLATVQCLIEGNKLRDIAIFTQH